jgi:hypothetical protein
MVIGVINKPYLQGALDPPRWWRPHRGCRHCSAGPGAGRCGWGCDSSHPPRPPLLRRRGLIWIFKNAIRYTDSSKWRFSFYKYRCRRFKHRILTASPWEIYFALASTVHIYSSLHLMLYLLCTCSRFPRSFLFLAICFFKPVYKVLRIFILKFFLPSSPILSLTLPSFFFPLKILL